MSERDYELVALVDMVLHSMKTSLDHRHFERSGMKGSWQAFVVPRILEIESMRLSVLPLRRMASHLANELFPNEMDVRVDLSHVLEKLDRLINDPAFVDFSKHIPLRMSAPRSRIERFGGAWSGISVYEAAEQLSNRMTGFLSEPTGEAQLDDIVLLRRLVPEQRVAPVQFKVSDGRISISEFPNHFDSLNAGNVEAAREVLLSAGKKIIEELKRSNCDCRLIEAVQNLHSQIESDVNIIRIGISNIGCEMMAAAYEHELSDAVSAQLRSHTRTVEMFAAQFPDWARFVENAATVKLAESDVQHISETTEKLIGELKARPEIVDPEVPVTLAQLNSFIHDPSVASKRAAFAVLRSIENLISKIFSYGIQFIDSTVKKTIESGSSIISKTVIVSLLSLALSGATGMTPVATKVGEMVWMKNAAELVQKQIEKLIKD